MDPATVRRLQRVLWPSSITLSTWSFAKVVVADFVDRLATMIGFKTKAPPTMEQILAWHLLRNHKIPPNSPSLDTQLYPTGENISHLPSFKEPNQSKKDSQNESENGIEEIIMDLRRQFSGPLAAFKSTYARSWTEAVSHPPRGCVIVSGLVEIETPKAFLVFDVLAHWDPRTKSYDMGSQVVALRRIQPKKQSPKI